MEILLGAHGYRIWAPQVIEDAKAHGLVLGSDGQLYDSEKGENLPEGVLPLQPLTEQEMQAYPEMNASRVVRNHVARYWDLMALANGSAVPVIGEQGVLPDKPGFTVEFLSARSESDQMQTSDKHTVLMPMRGHWQVVFSDGQTVLNPGDTCLIQPGTPYALSSSMSGETSVYRITATDDPAGPTWQAPN